MINKLNEEIKSWDKMEGAGAVYYMYGWGKKTQKDAESEAKEDNEKNKSESEESDYRDRTQGDRNAKHLAKARLYANTPQARLKKQRTELKKDLRG